MVVSGFASETQSPNAKFSNKSSQFVKEKLTVEEPNSHNQHIFSDRGTVQINKQLSGLQQKEGEVI